MSRSKRARAKERKHAQVRPPRAADETRPSVEPGRLAADRRRAAAVKLGVGAAAVASLGISMALARVTYAGHTKHPVQSLSIPQPLYRVVRENLLQGGILAPATAPPDATTSTS